MIPFNLERALAGDKVLTHSCQIVEQLTEFRCRDKYGRDGGKYLMGVVDGLLMALESKNLRMAPKPLSGFINYYGDGRVTVHDTKYEANIYHKNTSRTACIDLSNHNEGEGIE